MVPPKFTPEETIYFQAKDLISWKNKELLEKWKRRYPELIQNHLYQIWRKNSPLNSRPRLNAYGFGELYTAIHFADRGYKFLYEPWIENFLLDQPRKSKLAELRKSFQETFITHAGREVYGYITQTIANKIKKGQPDLFIYDEKEYFFVEVKKKGDKLTPEQKIFIEELEKFQSPIPIHIVHLKEK